MLYEPKINSLMKVNWWVIKKNLSSILVDDYYNTRTVQVLYILYYSATTFRDEVPHVSINLLYFKVFFLNYFNLNMFLNLLYFVENCPEVHLHLRMEMNNFNNITDKLNWIYFLSFIVFGVLETFVHVFYLIKTTSY